MRLCRFFAGRSDLRLTGRAGLTASTCVSIPMAFRETPTRDEHLVTHLYMVVIYASFLLTPKKSCADGSSIVISKDLLVPLHRQLTDAVREAITSGRLAAKQALPSTRELAESLSISRRTVVRSYNWTDQPGLPGDDFGLVEPSLVEPPHRLRAESFQPAPTPIENRCLSDFTKHIFRSNNEMVGFS